jgi:hypothetical protein
MGFSIGRRIVPACVLLVSLFGAAGLCAVGTALAPDATIFHETACLHDVVDLQITCFGHPDDQAAWKKLGIAYFAKSIARPGDYAQLAVDVLTRACSQEPDGDPELLAYLGAATARLTQTTKDPFMIMKYGNLSGAILDLAKARAPDNLTVRITSARCLMRFPGFMGKAATAFRDYEYGLRILDGQSYSEDRSMRKEIVSALVELSRQKKDGAAEKLYSGILATLE